LDHFDPKIIVFLPQGPDTQSMILEADSAKTFLLEELSKKKRINPRYSQRAFARHLNMSPGELSEVLNGRRNLSLRSAVRVAEALGLNETETKHLMQLTQIEKASKLGKEKIFTAKKAKGESAQLTQDMFHVVSDWYCFAILNLADTQDFRWDIPWIAKRLGITRAEVRTAIERLERIGLVENNEGYRHVTKDFVLSESATPSEAIRNYHRQMLHKSLHSLDFQRVNQRDITGIGFAVDVKNVESLKKDIADFQDQMISKYSKGKRNEVYHIEVSLFQVTQEVNYDE
jgi:uncharacterized protein (TIGR02147 family)